MPLDPNLDYAYAEAVEILLPNDAQGNAVAYRRWNGPGAWVYESQTYTFGGLLEVGDIEIGETLAKATSVTIDVSATADRDLFLAADPGPAAARVFEMWRSRNRGGAWGAWTVDGIYHGKLSAPRYQDGRLTIEIQRVFDDVWRGVPLRWTGTDQRRRYATDSGLDRADRIRRSGLVVAST